MAPETLQTRSEHSRSMEDAESLRAIQALKELGLLIPVSEVDMYHGRVKTPDEVEPWQVDPTFANGDNDSGNHNINQRPTLYLAEQGVANDYANIRHPEVIRSRYKESFQTDVQTYSEAERQAWLDRLDANRQESWKALPEEMRKSYPGGVDEMMPPDTLESLDQDYMIESEARRLEAKAPPEVQQARRQAAAQGLSLEIHPILSADTDATVLDFYFKNKISSLSDNDKLTYQAALSALIPPVTEAVAASFEAREQITLFTKELESLTALLSKDEIGALAKQTGVDGATALRLGSAYNARQIAQESFIYLADRLMEDRADIIQAGYPMKDDRKVPINLEYVQKLFREAHIVGAKLPLLTNTLKDSETGNPRLFEAVVYFDLERIGTESQIAANKADTWRKLGAFTNEFTVEPVQNTDYQKNLLKLLEDPHVKPERLVAAARQIPGYDEIFALDVGDWGGFSLAEHTETVLRNFEDNYADKLPVELIAPMQVMLLAHDLVGKPETMAIGEKGLEKQDKLAHARDFFDKAGMSEATSEFLLSIISEGVELAHETEIKEADPSAMEKLHALATKAVSKLRGVPADESHIEGYIELCKLLLTCDPSAYASN